MFRRLPGPGFHAPIVGRGIFSVTNMLGRVATAIVLLLALWGTAAPGPALAADAPITNPAARQIETFHAALLDTLKRGRELGIQGRYKALEPAVDAAFDFPVMIQFIVGPSWSTMSDSDHKSLTESFRRLTLANYAADFDNFNGQRFTMDPNVIQKGTDQFVQTTLVPAGDKPVPLIYRMRQVGESWKVIDILLEGYVSELATRRSDFSSTLASGGAAGLNKKMNDLADSLMSGARKPTP
jgi:phospholipid transport system substrate-binding protein